MTGDDLAAIAARGRVHLVGVGGAGMSAVAALLVASGLEVSGSDAGAGSLDAVRAAGVDAHRGHDAALVTGAGTVVVSSAIRPSNPELVRARELGIPVLHRSVALAALLRGRRGVAVAGAHGKTTTSAMVAVLLEHAGLDPSWAIGGTVAGRAGDPVGGAHAGRGEVVVVEADESDGSFLAYHPEIAVVTNVEPDHLDHYGSREAFEAAFTEFAASVSGALVACSDDPGAARLADAAQARGTRVLRYGTGVGADVRVGAWEPAGSGGRTTITEASGVPVPVRLGVPGAHNALNAAAAWTVGRLLGVSPDDAAAGLEAFGGTGRRFETRGTASGVRVVDDYAHHPTEVAALLRAARSVAGAGRVLVLFQPHLYSRTAAFAAEFAAALSAADAVVVTDVYAAREDPDPTVSGALITARMGQAARFVPDRVAAAHEIAAQARPGDLVLTVGAGDVTALGPVVLADLEARGGVGGTA
ncbi:UDP-N-acetylmuramate--L-alanine ligase [Isoptericola sp. b441]|uniref:UDP-N-acetylmuramate--L-alanine ligase n=1 Tax=Actinotalea lenta TaxID=3064654 RepID=A0ABT9DDN5_9CELL|nr:UDP-N-acetylmuramate--L-alanine ligase [Isoptericola sp. b441]MDO8107428.1 UDP-N-acetylmuramate--L-alanine ligase [Isoptericola sp. b441]